MNGGLPPSSPPLPPLPPLSPPVLDTTNPMATTTASTARAAVTITGVLDFFGFAELDALAPEKLLAPYAFPELGTKAEVCGWLLKDCVEGLGRLAAEAAPVP